MTAPLGWPVRDGDRCQLMGVLNVTPDSFSDGGRWLDPDAAVEHGLLLARQGADVVDVGGESTRPGAAPVPVEEELHRVVPVIARLAAAGVAISVDTMHARVAEAALEAGAVVLNDVSGGLADPDMPKLAARAGVPFIAMHWRGPSDRMDSLAVYADVVTDVVAELRARVDALVDAGVDPARLLVDPGLGFAKQAEHNWRLLAGLDRVVELGYPVLVGASRKRFLGSLLAGPDGTPAPVDARDAASAAVTTLAAAAGAFCVRVHSVPENRDAVLVAAAVTGRLR
ncbi:dihydropteroate synthase [Spongisporangium articulatum]|uniref:Dihydropteroate synthase n=1 Tax=Spongisporangium articulatum TaxID=3362603 RepID=A0ABW8ANF9_9ACTN